MDNVKNDSYYAQLIIDNKKAIQKYLGNKTYDEFLNDEQLIDAVMFRLKYYNEERIVSVLKDSLSNTKTRYYKVMYNIGAGSMDFSPMNWGNINVEGTLFLL